MAILSKNPVQAAGRPHEDHPRVKPSHRGEKRGGPTDSPPQRPSDAAGVRSEAGEQGELPGGTRPKHRGDALPPAEALPGSCTLTPAIPHTHSALRRDGVSASPPFMRA